MSSKWNILMILLFLIILNIQIYQTNNLNIKNEYNTEIWYNEKIYSDILHQLNKTKIKDSTLSDKREVNLSNSNNVSLENSRSPAFFDFNNNFKQRKSNIIHKNQNSLNQSLKKFFQTIAKLLIIRQQKNEKQQEEEKEEEEKEKVENKIIGQLNFIHENSSQLSMTKLNEINTNNDNNEEINNIYYKLNPEIGNFHHGNEKNNLNNGIKNQFERRVKRRINLDRWISQEYEGEEEMMKMHAFIVRDEVIPGCCMAAKSISATRYFMCSGAILTLTHAITSASCILFAGLYEKHIKADLAVLVGGSTSSPYVIKINLYEIHPNFAFQLDDPNHAKNNLAILFLNCGFYFCFMTNKPEKVIILFSFMMGTIVPPKLPKGIYDDVGHICCGEKCEIITIVQKADNHHVARVLKAKHIPPPVHDLNNNNKKQPDGRRRIKMRKSQRVKRNVSSWIRYKRSTGKLAEAPSFLFGDSKTASTTPIKNTEINSNFKRENIKNILDEIANAKKQSAEKKIHEKNNTLNILTEDGRRELIQKIAANLSIIDEKLAEVDWIKMEQIMEAKIPNVTKEKIEKFANNVVDETIKRLGSVIKIDEENITRNHVEQQQKTTSDEKINMFMSLLKETAHENHTFHDYTNIFTDIITSLLPPNNVSRVAVSSDLIVEEKDLVPPLPKYVNCPPLGAPVFINETLIAMVAYTCDDAENWVEWKYVSISKNLNWIRQRIAVEQKPPPTLCDSPFSGEDIGLDQLIHGSRSLNARKSMPLFSTDLEDNETLKIIKNQLKKAKEAEKYSRSFADSLLETEEGKHPYLHNSNQFNKFPKWRRTKTKFSDIINVNSNTCVTKPDGSTECESLSESSKDQ